MAVVPSKKISLVNTSTNIAAPKWSFTGRPDPKDKEEKVPGPAKYGTPSVETRFKRSQSASFGSSIREMEKKWAGQPGPGSYNPYDPNQTSAKFGFGSAARLPQRQIPVSPDPGKYETSKPLYNKTMTLGGRREGKKFSNASPGPGQYSDLTRGYQQMWKSDPKWGFGTSGRTEWASGDGPGPGRYTAPQEMGGPKAHIKSCPNFSMSSRRKPARADATPGPVFPHYTQFGV
mmetsp:Transcript_21034/g.58758  ORF Transcript_21034/g.58758 Transcript_21034/m.58758 type:complete len:232 (-) Transcript_21034:110-805(-)